MPVWWRNYKIHQITQKLFFFSLIFFTTHVWVTLEKTCLKWKVQSCFVACLSSAPELKSITASSVRAIILYSKKWRRLGEYLFMTEWYTSRFPVCLNCVKYSMSASNFASSMIEIKVKKNWSVFTKVLTIIYWCDNYLLMRQLSTKLYIYDVVIISLGDFYDHTNIYIYENLCSDLFYSPM